jgi:general secretion pathway protein K
MRHADHNVSCGKIGKSGTQRSGSALIIVLWVTGLLAMLVASLAFEAHLEARITNYYRNRTLAYYSARSGLALAELLISKSSGLQDSELDAARAEQERWYETARSLAEGGFVEIEHELPVEQGETAIISLRIVPEPARRNINVIARMQDDESMERILDVGGIPQELWPTLIESLYDWVDEDDTPRPDGAETDDYYANRDPPYRAKNAALDTVGEMLLIRGYTREILEGGRLTGGFFESGEVVVSGIGDLLTVHGDGKVNINAASQRVLMTIPGMDDIVASDVVRIRSEWTDGTGTGRQGFRSPEEFLAEFPDFPEGRRSLVTTGSAIFRIESVGVLYGVRHTIWCTVEHSGGRVRFLEWREDD